MRRYRAFLCLCLVMLFVAFPAAAQSNFSVVILVVDDFTGEPVDAAEIAAAHPEENCAVNLEGQAYATRGASATVAAELPPHGALVEEQLNSLLTTYAPTSDIQVVEVDIHGLSTAEIVDAITVAQLSYSADFYVLNMSFAIIPCEFIEGMIAMEAELSGAQSRNDLNGYRGIFNRAVAFYDRQVFPVNSQRFQEETDLDPLQSFIAANSVNMVAIASAGNFGLRYPFWPGAWGQVISVSASNGELFESTPAWDRRTNAPLLRNGTDRNALLISNYGEVMLPGEFSSETAGIVSGTSFAAPRLSFLAALLLADQGAFCLTEEGTPALATGDFTNPTLMTALNESCPALIDYIPE